jgi:hypothetical protein
MDHPMESISTEPAELLVRVLADRSRSVSGHCGRKRTRVKAECEGAVSLDIAEFLTIGEAAAWLKAAPNTLQNWITLKRFTAADGLRRFGGLTRIHFPTMRKRAIADTLLMVGTDTR